MSNDLTIPSVGTKGKCLNSTCDADAEVAVQVNTGQIRHYCQHHRQTADLGGHMIVVDEMPLSDAE